MERNQCSLKTLDITAVNYGQQETEKKEKAMFFNFCVKYHPQRKIWKITKRYSDFDQLRQKMLKSIKELPGLPKKHLFRLKKEKDLTNRMKGLELFLKTMIARQDVFTNEDFIQFLEVS